MIPVDVNEILHQARLSRNWVHKFVTESNLIDPQEEISKPGTIVYDGHYQAVLYAITMAAEDRYALPHSIHRLLLRDHPMVEVLRTRDITISGNTLLKPKHIKKMLWLWNREAQQTVDRLRVDDNSVDPAEATAEVWRLHAEFEAIHPYELYNGKVGRILMINHALLVDIEPWIVHADSKLDYLALLRQDPSQQWGVECPLSALEAP